MFDTGMQLVKSHYGEFMILPRISRRLSRSVSVQTYIWHAGVCISSSCVSKKQLEIKYQLYNFSILKLTSLIQTAYIIPLNEHTFDSLHPLLPWSYRSPSPKAPTDGPLRFPTAPRHGRSTAALQRPMPLTVRYRRPLADPSPASKSPNVTDTDRCP